MKYSRVVCVLSGGGAKAAAHVGAMRALEESGLTSSHFVGTSMGAVLAACFASGLGYDEVVRRITAVSRWDVAVPSPTLLLGPFARSFFREASLKETIAELVPARTFDELAVPLTVTAVDAKNGELVLFGAAGRPRVPLLDALYASCALPLYYPPARIGDRLYLDGGVRAVLPLDVAARFDPDLLFAVSVGPSLFAEPLEDRLPIPPLLKAHHDAMRILMAAQTAETVGRWKNGRLPLVLVQPHLKERATFAVESVVEYVEEGYRMAMRRLKEWREAGSAERRS